MITCIFCNILLFVQIYSAAIGLIRKRTIFASVIADTERLYAVCWLGCRYIPAYSPTATFRALFARMFLYHLPSVIHAGRWGWSLRQRARKIYLIVSENKSSDWKLSLIFAICCSRKRFWHYTEYINTAVSEGLQLSKRKMTVKRHFKKCSAEHDVTGVVL